MLHKKPGADRGWIYIWQSPSGKRYVGQTIYSVERRWQSHRANAYSPNAPDTIFCKAIRKYGVESFKCIFQISTCLERLGELEKELITHFNTTSPNGYNLTPGGEDNSGKANPRYRHDVTDDMIREDHANGLTTLESSRLRKMAQSTISARRIALGLRSNAPSGIPSRFTHEDVDEMERLWKKEGWWQKRIGELYGIKSHTVSGLIAGTGGPRKMNPR